MGPDAVLGMYEREEAPLAILMFAFCDAAIAEERGGSMLMLPRPHHLL